MFLVLDDHPVSRMGLKAVIHMTRPEEEVIEAGTVQEAMDCVQREKIDLAFVDLKLNGESGFDFLRKVHERNPEIRTILITSSSRDSDFREAKALGVDAYLLKDAFIDEIVFCLKSVERGGKFYSAALVDPRLSEEEKKLGTLTEREREVYELMCQGYTNLEISARLFITEGTAKRHVSNILSKLGSKNRVEAVIQSGQKGYLTEKNRGKWPGPQPKGEER